MQSAMHESVVAMTTLGKDKEPVPPAHSPSTAIRRRRGQGVTRSEEECRSIWGLNERFMIPQYVAASGVITGLVTGRATRDPEINGEVAFLVLQGRRRQG